MKKISQVFFIAGLIVSISFMGCQDAKNPTEPVNNSELTSSPKTDVATMREVLSQIEAAGDGADEIFKALPIEQQQEVLDALKEVTVEAKFSEIQPIPENVGDVKAEEVITLIPEGSKILPEELGLPNAKVGSWSKTATYTAKGPWPFYATLYRYSQTIQWTGDGKWITAASFYRTGTVQAPWWSYTKGDTWTKGGTSRYTKYTWYEAWSQAEFKYCPNIGVSSVSIGGCLQYKYPIIHQEVYGNGNYYLMRIGS